MVYIVSISERSTDSRVDVSKYSDLDQAIGFAFQLHQVSTCRHYITCRESAGQVVASFVRTDAFTAPTLASSDNSEQKPKSISFRRK